MQGTTTTRTRANGRVRGIFRARPPRGHRRRLGLAPILLVLLSLTGGYSIPSGSAIPASPSAPPAPAPDLDRVPLAFTPNVGFSDPAVRFETRALGGTVSFAPGEMVLSLPSAAPPPADTRALTAMDQDSLPPSPAILRLRFLGADPAPAMGADAPLSGKVNWLIGDDPGRWRTDVPTYGGISYKQLYEGVDLRYDGHGSTLKGTYLVAPGADPAGIRWRYDGALATDVDGAGNLLIRLPRPDVRSGAATSGRTLTEQAPVAWQEREGTRIPVGLRYDVADDGSVGFVVGAYDRTLPLTLDPTIVYSTYLGSSRQDQGRGIAVDGSGNVYITGLALGADFPVIGGQPFGGGNFTDAFVTKLNASGATVYSTYLGGSRAEEGYGIAVDASGNAYVTGYTNSANFPVTNGSNGSVYYGAIYDAFVAKLNGNGTLIYSTYLGGSSTDTGRGIAVDTSGNAYVTGYTNSANFPVTDGSTYHGGTNDIFVIRLDANGATVYSTLLGGSGDDEGSGVAVDRVGNAYVSGTTDSANFPVTPGNYPYRANGDAFVVKLDASGAEVYGMCLGGSGSDGATGIAVDAVGNVYITGAASSRDLFVTDGSAFNGGSHSPSPNGSMDGFVAKLDGSGSLVYSTYLGGNDQDYGTGIAVDTSGNAYVTGITYSTDFPVTDGSTNSGIPDAFVTKLNGSGARVYGTYLGGSYYTIGIGIAVDSHGDAYVTGGTGSATFPVTDASTYRGGDGDAFVTKLSLVTLVIVTPATLPGGVEATAYSQTITASGGTVPCTYAVTGGTLPPGLTLAANGALSGTPTNGGIYTFTAQCASGGQTATKDFTLTISNPLPALASLSPTSAYAGGMGFTLVVNGTNFVPASTVQWNGANRATTYVSATQLTATIGATDIAAGGTANVTVINPAPGGGTSGPIVFTIVSDTTPPTTTAAVVPALNAAGWNRTPVTVTLAATDNSGGSGVATTYYALDSTACTPTALAGCATYTAGSPVPVSADGTHTLTYFSADMAGNVEAAKTLTVKIDSVAPTITGTRTPAANANGWNNTDVTASFTCADNAGGSGIASCTAPVTVSAEGANQQVVGTATDAAGNSATATVVAISIDKTRPTTTVTPDRAANGAGWYNAPVAVTLNGTDNLSGVARTTYSLDGAPAVQYTAPFTISGDGTHTVSYSSVDKAGNAEDGKSLTLKIDATPPKIAATATPASIWPPDHKLVDVSVAVSATDGGSGLVGTFVLLSATASGAPGDIQGFVVGTASTSGKVTANKDEIYTLTYKATDSAGNSATVVVTIAVPHDQGH